MIKVLNINVNGTVLFVHGTGAFDGTWEWAVTADEPYFRKSDVTKIKTYIEYLKENNFSESHMEVNRGSTFIHKVSANPHDPMGLDWDKEDIAMFKNVEDWVPMFAKKLNKIEIQAGLLPTEKPNYVG